MIDKEVIFSKYDMSNLTEDDKAIIIKEFSELIGFQCLDLFNALGLKSHIEVMIVNQSDNQEYVLSFKTIEKFIGDRKRGAATDVSNSESKK